MPIKVQLTRREILIAEFVAKMRDDAGKLASADAGKFGNYMNTYDVHLRGCLGEEAAAKGLNKYWEGAGTDYHNDKDLGVEQVRMTVHENGRLIIRPEETQKPTINAPWVLVIQHDQTHYTLVGWIIGRDGINDKYLASPAGRAEAYFVPQHALLNFPIDYVEVEVY